MTSEDHNKYLAYSHLGYAAFQLLMALVMGGFFLMIMGLAATDPKGGPPAAFFALMFVFIMLFQLIFTVPSFIAGFGLLKKRDWAKSAGIVAGVLAAMSFPVGTAVCVYTFWFLLGAAGKDFYTGTSNSERSRRPSSLLNEPSMTDARDGWTKRESEYVPPSEMPNWRE